VKTGITDVKIAPRRWEKVISRKLLWINSRYLWSFTGKAPVPKEFPFVY